jgi:hypothetical protein
MGMASGSKRAQPSKAILCICDGPSLQVEADQLESEARRGVALIVGDSVSVSSGEATLAVEGSDDQSLASVVWFGVALLLGSEDPRHGLLELLHRNLHDAGAAGDLWKTINEATVGKRLRQQRA